MKRYLKTIITTALIFATFGADVAAAPPEPNSTASCLDDAKASFDNDSSDVDKKKTLAKYLGCFPSNFSDFESVFGYDSETETEGPLSEHSFDHFDFIAKNYDLFNRNDFSEKFVSVAAGASGGPYVDAEELLQQAALAPLTRDPAVGLAILSKHSDSEIERYWYFVLDNVESGTDTNLYSCPKSFGKTKACKILSEVKKHPNIQKD